LKKVTKKGVRTKPLLLWENGAPISKLERKKKPFCPVRMTEGGGERHRVHGNDRGIVLTGSCTSVNSCCSTMRLKEKTTKVMVEEERYLGLKRGESGDYKKKELGFGSDGRSHGEKKKKAGGGARKTAQGFGEKGGGLRNKLKGPKNSNDIRRGSSNAGGGKD